MKKINLIINHISLVLILLLLCYYSIFAPDSNVKQTRQEAQKANMLKQQVLVRR